MTTPEDYSLDNSKLPEATVSILRNDTEGFNKTFCLQCSNELQKLNVDELKVEQVMDCNQTLEFIPEVFANISLPFFVNETTLPIGEGWNSFVTSKDQVNCPVNCSIMTIGCMVEFHKGNVYGEPQDPY